MRHSFKRSIATCTTAFALVVMGFAAQPALAHDTIESTSPSADSTVEAGLIPIVLTFGEPVMQNSENAGLEVSVVGPLQSEPSERTDGCIDSVDSNVITETADIELPGTYTVSWRSVAEDGHPIEGTFNFEVTNTSGYQAGEVVACAKTMTVGTPKATGEKPTEPQYLFGISPQDGLIGGIVLIAIISVFGALNIRRQETERAAKEILKKRRENEK